MHRGAWAPSGLRDDRVTELRAAGFAMAAHFLLLLHLHVASVIASGSLFAARGALRLAGHDAANWMALRVISVVIDTLLVAAAIGLCVALRVAPWTAGWLAAKVLLLVLYVILGRFALKGTLPPGRRAVAYAAALLVFASIITIAWRHVSA